MVTEEVKETVVEEPTDVVVEEPTDANETEEELSPWYYFFSTGCGWCKKSTPVVEGLIDNGHDILMLDLAEPDNQALNKELQTEYKTQCGTPWFINADTGKGICGFREKDILEKWLNGEDIPVPPRPTGPPPKTPFQGSTNKEDIAWKKEYKKWVKDNEHMGDEWVKRQRSASEIIDAPRPKSDPPIPPMGPALATASEEDIDNWAVATQKWQKENSHLPKQQDTVNVVKQLKNRRVQLLQQQAGTVPGVPGAGPPPPGVNSTQLNTLDARVQALEVKLDRILSHFGVK